MRRLLSCLMFAVLGTPAWAGPADSAIDRILQEYFKIHEALAADSTQGIDQAAQQIAKIAATAKPSGAEISDLFQQIQTAARKIQGQPLEQAREAFFDLSRPLLVYLNLHHSNKAGYYRYFCPMANKGWIQAEVGARNPYYGSAMPTCGQLIE